MKSCSIKKCEKRIHAKGMCARHYYQILRKGKISGSSSRTRYDLNKLTTEGDICIIEVYDNQGYVKAEAIIDRENLEKVKGIKWSQLKNGAISNKKFGYLHRRIMGYPKKFVDHKDRNRLNNRTSNLRLCTNAENVRNSGCRANNTSGYKGVSWVSKIEKWASYITFNYNRINIGYFDSKIDAAKAYDKMAKELHCDYACINFGERYAS